MSGAPPNADLANLASLLGEENVRTLVRTFLQECPVLLETLRTGDRRTRQRIAHSLKSNTRVLGGHLLSDRMAALEHRLADLTQPDLDPTEFESISAEMEHFAAPLRVFVS